MSALAYLTLTTLKNRVRGVFRSPAKLIYSVIVVALLAFVVFIGAAGEGGDSSASPNSQLGAIAVGYFALMFLMTANSGFSTGMSVFKMPDVNFLFAGPFRPLRVLFHGMLNQMGTALVLAVVILFQYGWMHTSYGVGFGGLLVFVLGYGLAVFTGQLTAMVIYCLSSGRDRVRKALRFVYVAVTALWALYLGWRALGAGSALGGLCDAMVDPIGRLFPVAGWLGAACYEAILGNYSPAALLTLLWAAYSAALVIVMAKADQDYYEDVLQSTETAFLTQAAAKEGRVADTAPRNVSVGKTGLGGGRGASAFYYKHRVENRRSRKWLLSGIELVCVIANLGFAFLMRGEGIVAPLAFAAYMMFLLRRHGPAHEGDDQALRLPRARAADEKAALVPARERGGLRRQRAAELRAHVLLCRGPAHEHRRRGRGVFQLRLPLRRRQPGDGARLRQRDGEGARLPLLLHRAHPDGRARRRRRRFRLLRPARVGRAARPRGRQCAHNAAGGVPVPEHTGERRTG